MAMGKAFRLYEKLKPSNVHSIILEHRNNSQSLMFESGVVAVLTVQEIDSLKIQYKKLLDAYGCLGVLPINYSENTFLYLVMVTGCFSVGKIYDSEIFRITQTILIPLHYNQTNIEDRIAEVRKLLNSGTFYFSWSSRSQNTLDITLSAQQKNELNETDNQFFWNRMLYVHFVNFGVNTEDWLLKAICGSIEIRTVYVGHRQARAVLISRLSCDRVGTRFNVRGINDDGHVANFVETEQIVYVDNELSSYIQIRGSVPLFWEQPGIQVGSHKIKISRGLEVSAPAFNKHFMFLKRRYYGNQLILNLLGSNLIGNKEGEAMLSERFQYQQNISQHSNIPHIVFDYHQECRNGNLKNISKLKNKLITYFEQLNVFYAIEGKKILSQQGTIRTNCLDCLDRTNSVQAYIGIEILNKQLLLLKINNKQQIVSRFVEVFQQMWINNGNEISKIYAGTGAIQGNSKIIDGARSAARTIQNNLLDTNKQEAIDLLLLSLPLNAELSDRARLLLPNNMLYAHSNLLEEMCKRCKQYIYNKTIRISVATYNVNGGKHFRSVAYKDIGLSDWLLDTSAKYEIRNVEGSKECPVDLFAIGFEEIVDLNATNIMTTSSENAKAWAGELQKVLSRDHKYVLVTYQQLVGVCLYIFIRLEHANFLRDIAVNCVKTGLGGTAGNKGAVAIRFTLFSTSFCFICAHFTAGQSQVNERNADYTEITKKIVFPTGRTLDAHDYVFWCGDFNYRIDIDKEEIKKFIKNNEISKLLIHDQLKKQQLLGNIFQNFIEGSINFHPTYKYDLFSDDYDTSEKCRQPAWTDRILWKRQKYMYNIDNDTDWNPGKLIYYGRSELKQSDHRPIIATIDIDIHCVNIKQRDNVYQQINKVLGPPDATIFISIDTKMENDNFDDSFMNILLQELSGLGEIILVRYIGNIIWITFRNGQSALAAVQKGFLTICNKKLYLKLKSPNWMEKFNKHVDIIEEDTFLSTVISKWELFNPNQELCSATLPLQRLNPPARPPQPMKTKIQNNLSPILSETKQINAETNFIHDKVIDTNSAFNSIDDKIPETIISIYSENPNSPKPMLTNPPPLPSRNQPLVHLQTPPPIPARLCGEPPIPVRNNN